MGEQMLKLIVNEVNNILNTEYNMISFDSLSKEALLQIFVDCLHKMDSFPKMDVQRNMDETITRLVKFLLDIKTPLPMGVGVNDFTDGIIHGKRNMMQPTLFWILSNRDEVKKRSYLSKYLIKVDLNPAIINEPDMEQLLQQYDELIQQFKHIYTQTTKYSKVAVTTVNLRNDIEKQTKDISNILELTAKQKAKMENIPNKETLLVSVKALRAEMCNEKQVSDQIQGQAEQLAQLERELRAGQDRAAIDDVSTSDPAQRLQQQTQAARALLSGRLATELESLQAQLRACEQAGGSEPSDAQLAALSERLERGQSELRSLVERDARENEAAARARPADDKLAQFRQQAAAVSNSRRLAAQQLEQLRDECAVRSEHIGERERQLREAVGAAALPHGEDLRQFVGGLRGQSQSYKERRTRLLELQAESGVLARTRDLLIAREPTLGGARLPALSRDQPPPNDARRACTQLLARAAQLRADIASIVRHQRDSRESFDVLHQTHRHKKQIYDVALVNFNNNVTQLQDEVRKLEENVTKEEQKWKEIRTLIEEKEALLENLFKEVAENDEEVAKQSHLEMLKEKAKQEDVKREQLESEVVKCEKDKEEREQQVAMWHSALALLQCKRN